MGAENICIGRGHRPLHWRGSRRRGSGRRRAKCAIATAAKRKAAANAGAGVTGKPQRKRRGKEQNQGFGAPWVYPKLIAHGQRVPAPDIWEWASKTQRF